jgi:hypothetical protein
VVYVRTGVSNIQYVTDINDKKQLSMQPNIGLGLKIKSVSLDYALTDIGDNSVALYSNIFSLKFDLFKNPAHDQTLLLILRSAPTTAWFRSGSSPMAMNGSTMTGSIGVSRVQHGLHRLDSATLGGFRLPDRSRWIRLTSCSSGAKSRSRSTSKAGKMAC